LLLMSFNLETNREELENKTNHFLSTTDQKIDLAKRT
jgi:hypothetical protein